MFDPYANEVTAAGLATLQTDATDNSATMSPAPAAAAPALGGGVPSVRVVQKLVEPGPDINSGAAKLGLGDRLIMKDFSGLLWAGDPDMHEPVQGFLGNCPLSAVLCAMAHVPNQRARLRRDIISSRTIEVHSNRQRKASEYFVNDVPNPLPYVSVPGPFETNRLIFVRFQRIFVTHTVGRTPEESVQIAALVNKLASVPVTSVLHVNTDHGGIHYMFTMNGALWPSIIEKAYAVGRGHNSYQGINADVGLAEAMRDMTGSAEEEHLVVTPNPGGPPPPPPITNKQLRTWLGGHSSRPTILGSPDAPTRTDVTPNHTFAVIGFNGKNVTVINALEETPAAREVTVPFAELRGNFAEIVRGSK